MEVVFQTGDPLGAPAKLTARGVTMAKPKMLHEAEDHVGVSCLFEDSDGNLLSVYGLVPNAVWAKLG